MSGAWIAAFAALWLTVLVLGFGVLGILRRFGAVLEEAEKRLVTQEFGAPLLSVTDDFQLYDERGRIALARGTITQPTLLLFVEPGCGPCRDLIDQLKGVADAIDHVPFAVVIEDSRRARSVKIPSALRVLYDRDGEAFRVFRNLATPQAYVVDEGGVVLARRVPTSVLDLSEMARFQRKGGDRRQAQSVPAAAVPE
jgi:thiol-disulfide isomerase/thioredoxin